MMNLSPLTSITSPAIHQPIHPVEIGPCFGRCASPISTSSNIWHLYQVFHQLSIEGDLKKKVSSLIDDHTASYCGSSIQLSTSVRNRGLHFTHGSPRQCSMYTLSRPAYASHMHEETIAVKINTLWVSEFYFLV